MLVSLGDRVLVAKGHEDPDRAAEGRWARWTGLALRHPGRTLVAGLALLLLLAAPAIGMRLGMPGAGVVDEGRSSRDGYEMLVESFGPGAAAPLFVTVPRRRRPRPVVDLAAADPNVVDAQIVAEPAATGRTVVRVTPATAVDDRRRPPTWSADSATDHRRRRARGRTSAARPPRTTTSPRCSPAGRRSPSASSCSWRSCCCSSCSAA